MTQSLPAGPVKAPQAVLQVANMSISGVVLDPNGAPAAGVTVLARGQDKWDVRQSTTDESGKFKIEGLTAGNVLVGAEGEESYGEAEAGDTDVVIKLESADPHSTSQPAPPDKEEDVLSDEDF